MVPKIAEDEVLSRAIDDSCQLEENGRRQPRYFYGLYINIKSITNVSLHATMSAGEETKSREMEVKIRYKKIMLSTGSVPVHKLS